jgi:hypothetical protein
MVRKTSFTLALFFALILTACAEATPSGLTPVASTVIVAGTVVPGTPSALTPAPFPSEPPPTPIPSLPSGLSPTALKYRLLDKYPDFFFCDPDLYPIARGNEGQLAIEHFPEIQANQEEFQAILVHKGLSGLTTFTDAQKLLIYRDYKKLNAIQLELSGAVYQFQLRTADKNQQGFLISGTIDGQGRITVQERIPGIAACPICLAAWTRIATPHGSVAVEDLKTGDTVWTLNRAGKRVPATVLKVAHTAVPVGQRVVHIVLEDGREVWVSPGHPTSDGRHVADLKTGDLLDGSRVVSLAYVAYSGLATYDLLPSGDTGFYWADNILLGSTLHP